jgi:16S rRNA (guanine527-N7)-methyltransferase
MAPQRPTPESELTIAREVIARGLEALALDPEPLVVDRLTSLAGLLSSWAPRMNLTGHRGAEEIARRLILDALALIESLPEFESLADLGSGAGFPGLPIAILFPDRKLVSVEARSRRVSFQRTVVRELGIQNVTILHGRIESLAPQPCHGVVAQAVAPAERVLEWLLPWCEDGGWLAIPGSEESLASPPRDAPTHEDAEVRSYRVPLEGADRRVWLARKCAVPTAQPGPAPE